MMVDAIVRFAVNETGKNTWVVDYQANDIQLNDYFSEFVSHDDADSLICTKEAEEKLREKYGTETEFKNKLLLATFSYRSVSSFNGEHTDYEDVTEIIDVLILDNDYKTTWQRNLTTMYGHNTLEELKDNEASEDIHEWEEFYEEDFSFFKPKEINPLAGFLK